MPGAGSPYVGLGRPNAPLWANWQLFVLTEEGLTPLGGDLDRPVAVSTYGDLVDP